MLGYKSPTFLAPWGDDPEMRVLRSFPEAPAHLSPRCPQRKPAHLCGLNWLLASAGASGDLLPDKLALECLSQGLWLTPPTQRRLGVRGWQIALGPQLGVPLESSPGPTCKAGGLGGSPELPVRSLPRHSFQKGLNKYVQQEGEPRLSPPAGGKLNCARCCC